LSPRGDRVRAGRRVLSLTHPEKIYFPGRPPITKRELVDYYAAVAPAMVPHTRNRPAMLQRFPDGITGEGFYQKEISDWFPDWIPRATVPKQRGQVTQVLVNDAATLVYLATQGCLTPHVWLSRIDRPDNPDRLIFDLDPPRGFEQARAAARLVRELLGELGLASLLMTTGGRGLHVIVPLDRRAGFDAVRGFARGAASLLAQRHRSLLTVESRIAQRRGRLYLDTTRNAYAQTAVAPYAVRAQPGAPVATPLAWDELDDKQLDSRTYTIRNLRHRLEQPDPWRPAPRGQGLEAAARRLARLAGSD
jgi:bifunctional non-homologous end joining protein LigD